MNNEHLKKEIIELLNRDKRLLDMLSLPPSAMYIPFTKSRESFFVLVSLCLWPQMKSFSNLSYACLIALRLIIPSGLLLDMAGIEIILYIVDGKRSNRIMRLSVKSQALENALILSENDLKQERPADGIACGWYLEKPGK